MRYSMSYVEISQRFMSVWVFETLKPISERRVAFSWHSAVLYAGLGTLGYKRPNLLQMCLYRNVFSSSTMHCVWIFVSCKLSWYYIAKSCHIIFSSYSRSLRDIDVCKTLRNACNTLQSCDNAEIIRHWTRAPREATLFRTEHASLCICMLWTFDLWD